VRPRGLDGARLSRSSSSSSMLRSYCCPVLQLRAHAGLPRDLAQADHLTSRQRAVGRLRENLLWLSLCRLYAECSLLLLLSLLEKQREMPTLQDKNGIPLRVKIGERGRASGCGPARPAATSACGHLFDSSRSCAHPQAGMQTALTFERTCAQDCDARVWKN
jgi:hypothetical protein